MDTRPPQGSALVPAPEPSPAPTEQSGAPTGTEVRARRWRLFRNLLVFQAKLVVDGLKDLALGPLSLFAAALGLIYDREDPERRFRSLLRHGQSFDRWVDLFGEGGPAALPAAEDDPDAAPAPRSEGLDSYVAQIEQVLIEQYRRGGLTSKAKDAIDNAIDGLHDRDTRDENGPTDQGAPPPSQPQ